MEVERHTVCAAAILSIAPSAAPTFVVDTREHCGGLCGLCGFVGRGRVVGMRVEFELVVGVGVLMRI